MNTFLHHYKAPISESDFNEISGYVKAMRALMLQLQEMTQFKPENRMVDSVVILDMIVATQAEFEPMVEELKKRLADKPEPVYAIGDGVRTLE